MAEIMYNTLKSLNRKTVPFGIGTWSLAGPLKYGKMNIGRGNVNKSKIREVLNFANMQGLNFIDTADSYGLGKVEESLGRIFSNKDIIICTKFGNVFTNGVYYQDFSIEYLKKCINNSLTRLKKKSIDIMLFHSPPDDYSWKNYDNEALSSILKEGKVKAFGVSCKSYKGAINCMESGFGQVIEVIYNLLDRRIENMVLPLAEKYGYDVIIKVPLAHGMLGGKLSRSDFIEGDHRLNFTDQEYEWINNARKKLSFLDELPGGIIVSALRFSMTPKQNTVVVPGVHKKEHINIIRQAMLLGPLDDKYIKMINTSLPKTYLGWN